VKIFNAFRKDEVVGTKVIVCSLYENYQDLVKADAEIYRRFYPATAATSFQGPDEMIDAIQSGYDIVHLLCDVNPNGAIGKSSVTGTELISKCCASGVKLLWIGSDNTSDAYIAGFKVSGKRLNLVMTIKRDGQKFPCFLEKLLFKMSYGDPMPVAWVSLCPQVTSSSHPEIPESIFFAGRPKARLR
jgi:hypothetical protein